MIQPCLCVYPAGRLSLNMENHASRIPKKWISRLTALLDSSVCGLRNRIFKKKKKSTFRTQKNRREDHARQYVGAAGERAHAAATSAGKLLFAAARRGRAFSLSQSPL